MAELKVEELVVLVVVMVVVVVVVVVTVMERLEHHRQYPCVLPFCSKAARPAGTEEWCGFGLIVGCLMSLQHASVSHGRICTDNFTCCHTEVEVADQTFNLTWSQYTDTGPTSPSADPTVQGAWQGSHWSANV